MAMQGMPTDAQVMGGESLSTVMQNMTISRYFIVAGMAILIYDHLITFGDELEFVWKRKKNFISWVFLVNRYLTPLVLTVDLYDKLGFANNLTVEFCQRWVVAEVTLHFSTQAAIHGVVAIRVNALWGNRPAIRYGLALGWSAYFITTMTIALAAVLEDKTSFAPSPIVHSCFGLIGPFVWSVWLAPLFLEAALFAMTVIKMVQQSRRWIVTVPLAYILYRDGLIYFIVIALCSVFNLVVWKSCPISLYALAKYCTLGVVNTMGSRMVLNLRKQGAIESSETLPVNVHFVDPRTDSADHRPDDDKFLSKLEPRVHQPYGDLGCSGSSSVESDLGSQAASSASAPTPTGRGKARKPDPYFYNRRIAKLRNLKAKRPDVSRIAGSSTPRPRHNLSAIYRNAPRHVQVEEHWSDGQSIISGTRLATEDGDWYDMEMLPLPPLAPPPCPEGSRTS